MTIHRLKCHPEPFAALERGDKLYEVRRADRPFQVGDQLLLEEYVPEGAVVTDANGVAWRQSLSHYTGRRLLRRVGYITAPGTWGLPADVCVLGFESPADFRDGVVVALRDALNELIRRAADPDLRGPFKTPWVMLEGAVEDARAVLRQIEVPHPSSAPTRPTSAHEAEFPEAPRAD